MFNLRDSLPNKRVPSRSCTQPSNFLHVLCAMKAVHDDEGRLSASIQQTALQCWCEAAGRDSSENSKRWKCDVITVGSEGFQILLVNLEPGLHFSSFATRHLFPRCRWCPRCRWGCGWYDTCRDAGVACWRFLHHCFQIQVVKVGMCSHHISSLMRRKEQTTVPLSRSNVIWIEQFHAIPGLWCFPDASYTYKILKSAFPPSKDARSRKGGSAVSRCDAQPTTKRYKQQVGSNTLTFCLGWCFGEIKDKTPTHPACFFQQSWNYRCASQLRKQFQSFLKRSPDERDRLDAWTNEGVYSFIVNPSISLDGYIWELWSPLGRRTLEMCSK